MTFGRWSPGGRGRLGYRAVRHETAVGVRFQRQRPATRPAARRPSSRAVPSADRVREPSARHRYRAPQEPVE